ncbi:MAG: hypothetical protein WDN69_28010 [Aliidongia sp.]
MTERAAHEVLSLPMYPQLDDTAVAEVIDAFRAMLGESTAERQRTAS